jgi:hypothetical protein
VSAKGWIVGITFFYQIGDRSTLELFLKMEKLVEIESTRNREKTGAWNALWVEEGNGLGHLSKKLVLFMGFLSP